MSIARTLVLGSLTLSSVVFAKTSVVKKPASSMSIAGESLSTISQEKLEGALRAAAKAQGLEPSGSLLMPTECQWQSAMFKFKKGKAELDFFLKRPAPAVDDDCDASRWRRPDEEATNDKATMVYDKKAALVVWIAPSGEAAKADAKRVFDALVKR